MISKLSFSTSVSLDKTSIPASMLSSVTVASSFTATGASFSGVTVTLTVPMLDPPFPSLTVYVKLSAPLKLAAGV